MHKTESDWTRPEWAEMPGAMHFLPCGPGKHRVSVGFSSCFLSQPIDQVELTGD